MEAADNGIKSVKVIRMAFDGTKIDEQSYQLSRLSDLPPYQDALWIAENGEAYAVLFSAGPKTADQQLDIFDKNGHRIASYPIPVAILDDAQWQPISINQNGDVWVNTRYYTNE